MEGESTAVLWGNPLFGTASERGYYEDEIRSVEGPDAGRGGPEGTAELVEKSAS